MKVYLLVNSLESGSIFEQVLILFIFQDISLSILHFNLCLCFESGYKFRNKVVLLVCFFILVLDLILSMNYSLTSSFKNSLITFRRLISFQLLASVSITRFSKKEVGSSLTFLTKDLGIVIDLSLFAYPLIIH